MFSFVDEAFFLQIKDTTIDRVPVRIYSPLNTNNDETKLLPAIIYYHGGAFYMGSIGKCNYYLSSIE